jgi:2-polyprenyl-3-methyl-5-hydroxy-6-metoxy-1,4-benzoquinol methylase
MMEDCPICGRERRACFEATILNKFTVKYFFCRGCGLLQTESPYWLEEAYQRAILDIDTGLVSRNIALSKRLSPLLFFALGKAEPYLDIAGGYGLLTRLMRDIGFDFYWSDPYCENIFAKGFASPPPGHITRFAALTAFEVLEHVHDPVAFLEGHFRQSRPSMMIMSTELFAGDPPSPNRWWYYALGGGQHISFYQRKTLDALADRLSLRAYSSNGLHILSKRVYSARLMRMMTGRFAYHILSQYVRRRMSSRTFVDHESIAGDCLKNSP